MKNIYIKVRPIIMLVFLILAATSPLTSLWLTLLAIPFAIMLVNLTQFEKMSKSSKRGATFMDKDELIHAQLKRRRNTVKHRSMARMAQPTFIPSKEKLDRLFDQDVLGKSN